MRKIIAVALAVVMIACAAVASVQAAATDTAPASAGKATVTLVGIKGETVSQEFNVGDTFKATVYLNASGAISDPKYGISSVSATQFYDSDILAPADEYNQVAGSSDYGMAKDIASILPILGSNGVVNLGISGKAVYNGSMAAKAGYKFTTDTSALVVLQYTVIAPGAVTISNSATTIAASDTMLTRLVDRGVIKNENFTTPVALELVSAASVSFTVSGSYESSDLEDFEDEAISIQLIQGDEVKYSVPCADSEGEYSINDVAEGDYTLHVTRKNHVDHDYDITVSDDTVQDVVIYPIGDITGDGDVTLKDYRKAYRIVQEKDDINDLDPYLLKCGDVSGKDDDITLKDYRQIYRHVAELSSLWT